MGVFTLFLKFIPIIAFVGALAYLFMLFQYKGLFSTNTSPSVEEEDINVRQEKRGVIVSLFSAILLNIIGALFAALRIPKDKIVFNFGFILGPVLGFMLDMGFGTDNGLSIFKKDKTLWIKYMLSNLANVKFLRFIVTVLLDMFISNPVQDQMQISLKPHTNAMQTNFIGRFTAKNMPSIIQSIVALVTFLAYTNQTRFQWAYLDKPEGEDETKEFQQSTLNIMLATAIAGTVFLIAPSEIKQSQKLMYIIFAFACLSLMGMIPDSKKQSDLSVMVGGVIFLMFLLYGIILPMFYIGREKKVKKV
tara:strand:+ start:2386 stop:3300 length:915 start_codon:yes stop_codon:yes gene_type:complete